MMNEPRTIVLAEGNSREVELTIEACAEHHRGNRTGEFRAVLNELPRERI